MTLKVIWPEVSILNYFKEPLIAWINLCNGTVFRLIAFKTLIPRDSLFIGIEHIGCFFFPIDKELNAEYVSQKLNIPISDAACLADWMNVQIDIEAKQQGEYSNNYFESNQKYALLSESQIDFLQPKRIGKEENEEKEQI